MTIFQALLKFTASNKIRRTSWEPGAHIYHDSKDIRPRISTDNSIYQFKPEDIKANDWEIFLDSNS